MNGKLLHFYYTEVFEVDTEHEIRNCGTRQNTRLSLRGWSWAFENLKSC